MSELLELSEEEEYDRQILLSNILEYNGKEIENMYELKKIITSSEILSVIDKELSWEDSHYIRTWFFVEQRKPETKEQIRQNTKKMMDKFYQKIKIYLD